jgi:hypothetical protein
MTFALLAAVALGQPPAGPLSPADLPPPPRPGEAAPAAATADMAVYGHINFWSSADSPEVTRRKAVAVLAAQPDARFAAATPSGTVEGYTADARVVVLTLPVDDKVRVYSLTVARRNEVAKCLAVAVGTGMMARTTAAGPERFGRPDPDVEKTLPTLDWHTEVRPQLANSQDLIPAATRLAGRAGLVMMPSPEPSPFEAVCGSAAHTADRAGLVTHICAPGTSGIATHFLTTAVAAPGRRPPQPARAALEALTRLLYD